MLNKYKSILAAVLLLSTTVTFTSCDKTESDEFEYVSESGKLAGEWFVTLKEGNNVVVKYKKLTTFNTAAANSDLWLQANQMGATYSFKVVSKTDVANYAMSVENGSNVLTTAGVAPTVTVLNGKVLPKQGHSLSGNVVDSIYMEVKYSTIPGKTFVLSGHQRTGFAEDEAH